MTDITVKDFSKTIGLPVARLIDQLELAGVEKKKENDLISDEEKMQLLDYVRNNQHSSSFGWGVPPPSLSGWDVSDDWEGGAK